MFSRSATRSARVLGAGSALSLTLATLLAVPAPARADLGDVVGIAIVGGALYCAANPDKCGGTKRTTGGTRSAGPADAVGLSRDQAMWVQSGLQSMGFYQGAIDGALGQGSRAAIRAYQAAIGAPATGVMTAVQVNDIVALSPSFAGYAPGDRGLFAADLANDLSRDEVRLLQAALNQQGFNAGAVDGALGGQTRNAIAAYKATQGLPGGPVASRRLLAYLQGQPAPLPAGAQFTAAGRAAPAPVVMAPAPVVAPPATPTPAAVAPAPVPAPVPDGLDILGIALGMAPAQVSERLAAELGGGLLTETAAGAAFGGGGRLSLADLAQSPGWPEAPAERVLTFYDSMAPGEGALAVLRQISLPESIDQAVFDAEILTDLLLRYGSETRVGESLTWVSDAAARARAEADPAALAACGALALEASSGAGLWSAGAGPRLDATAGAVTARCGTVLSVSFTPGLLTIAMWNADALAGPEAGGGAPKIKF